jgi:hypothetical protein
VILKQEVMSVRAFWNILLKIIGIVLVIEGGHIILGLIATCSFFIDNMHETAEIIWWIASVSLSVIFYFFILWLFVFKTSWLIDKLRLEKGFEEESIVFKNDFSAIVTVAVIVIGGIMLIDALPELCKRVFVYYQEKSIHFKESPTTAWIIVYVIKAIIGYLLMTNSKQITGFIYRKSGKNEEKTHKNL